VRGSRQADGAGADDDNGQRGVAHVLTPRSGCRVWWRQPRHAVMVSDMIGSDN
jgi:hypothetical protein